MEPRAICPPPLGAGADAGGSPRGGARGAPAAAVLRDGERPRHHRPARHFTAPPPLHLLPSPPRPPAHFRPSSLAFPPLSTPSTTARPSPPPRRREEGLRGLWRGALPAVQRAALVNLGELAAYDTAKQLLLDSGAHSIPRSQRGAISGLCAWCWSPGRGRRRRMLPLRNKPPAGAFPGGEGPALHVGAAAASGLVATVCSTPADVVKTRLMSQRAGAAARPARPPAAPPHPAPPPLPSGTPHGGTVKRLSPAAPPADAPQYRGAVDCVVKSVRAEGFGVLYRGFWPTWARLGAHPAWPAGEGCRPARRRGRGDSPVMRGAAAPPAAPHPPINPRCPPVAAAAGPWQLTFWVTFEQLRKLTGMGGF